MKRIDGLWGTIVSYENLFGAAKAAAACKRTRQDIARFNLNLENEIVILRNELQRQTYQPGPYRCFEVHEPKTRLISAAPFRDRVVHHALTRVIEPIFEKRFIHNSFACRKGFGTHRALAVARDACRKYPYVLKCDIRKYFPSIDHEVIRKLMARVIKCPKTLWLATTIVNASNPQEPAHFYFPGDDLFTPYERRRGLPLGNQTSQFFANVYLNPLDHFIVRTLHPGVYLRYVDDFLLFGQDKAELGKMRSSIEKFLVDYRLKIHPRKSRAYRTANGPTFLGWRIFPDRMRLVRPDIVRFRRRMMRMQAGYAVGENDWKDIDPRVQAWIAHAAHGDTWKLREQIFGQFTFQRGSAAGPSGRVLEQQCQEHPRIQSQ